MSGYGRRADDEHEPILVRVDEAARLLGVSPSSIRRLLIANAIPSVRLGRRVLIPVRALEALAEFQDAPERLTPI